MEENQQQLREDPTDELTDEEDDIIDQDSLRTDSDDDNNLNTTIDLK